MSYLESIFLGIVQGATEFLPISSSGHLVIFPWLFGFEDPGLTFDVALHAGTLLALLAYFWRDWIELFKGAGGVLCRSQPYSKNVQAQLFVAILLATIPGALAGYFLNDLAETVLRHPLLVAFDMAFLGLLLFLVDRKGVNGKGLTHLTLRDALLIGVSQALALFPGVSRSGITITMALFLGFSRVAAARFSFLLATPIMFGALVFKLKDLSVITGPIVVGVLTSTITGFLAIATLLRYVQTQNYHIFCYYRFGFSILVFGIFLARL